jgi:microcystin degradation protein MlrC
MTRVAIGSFMQETNTFSPCPTTVEDFAAYYLHRGDDILTGYGAARLEVPGFLHVLAGAGITPVPLIATQAYSSGALTRATFDAILTELLDRLRDAGPVDGVLLALHGAMAVEDEGDADGEILARLCAALPPGIPIGVSLDLHGHITPRMLQPDTFLIGYREYPHIDHFETAERVARLMLDRLAGRRRPVMALAKRPVLFSPVRARTAEPPLSDIVAEARRLEDAGAILHASLFPVQPWLDVPGLGFAALVCADADAAAAQAAADHLADRAFAARHDAEPDLVPVDEAIRIGLASPGVTVVGDGGDAPSSGAPADNATILKRLLALGADRADRLTYLTLRDPDAVRRATEAGPGATVTLQVGHSLSSQDGEPVTVTGIVRLIADGAYTMHDAGARGVEIHQGPTALLAIGAIRLLLRSLPGFEWDTGVFTAFGLDLRHPALVFVKSPSHFRVSYAPVAARILSADTPGAAVCNMRALKLRHATRPLFPLDAI